MGLGDDLAVEEEKEAEQEEEEQKEEKVVDNTPKVSEELLKFRADWRNRCIEMDELAREEGTSRAGKSSFAELFEAKRESHVEAKSEQ